ncbi:uncharacterized protein [Nicotiana tomentosiformis]|uniref:uncharacterized protein n=1 Tax=Nicotiana tomentosiformis TaxID=4098 RepID=UPI00388CDE20
MPLKTTIAQKGKSVAGEITSRVPRVTRTRRESHSENPSQTSHTSPSPGELQGAPAPAPAPVRSAPQPDAPGQETWDAIKLLTRLVAAHARHHEVGMGHADRSVSAMVRDFINLDPPIFTGADPNEDPRVFIARMQRTLRVMMATATELVELASYRLQDVEFNWYESWELSRELRQARFDRLLTLRQGNMSVQEYNPQFDLVPRYAPIIPDMDISRIQAYTKGVEECSTLSYVILLVASKFGIKLELVKPFDVSTPVRGAHFGVERRFVEGFSSLSTPLTKLTQKGAKFQWIDACEWSFEALKDRLTSAPVLMLPEGIDGYVIYYDASGIRLGCVLMQHGKHIFKQKELNLRQRRGLELLKYYDVDNLYHSGKANVVADALSRRSMGSLSYLQPEKRRIAHEIHQVATLGVRLLDSGDIGITTQDTATSSLVTEVKERQYEDPALVHYRDTTSYKEKTPFEITEDGVLRYRGRLCVPNVAGLCRQVKIEHQKPGGLLQAMEIPTWK